DAGGRGPAGDRSLGRADPAASACDPRAARLARGRRRRPGGAGAGLRAQRPLSSPRSAVLPRRHRREPDERQLPRVADGGRAGAGEDELRAARNRGQMRHAPVRRRARPGAAARHVHGASYSPDGARLLFSSSQNDNTDVYVAQFDGSGVRRVTDARGIDISASWSPDGKRIAFVSERAGTPQIYSMTVEGSDVRRLTFQGNYNQEPAWSPKGDLIAFSGRDEHRVFDLYTVAVDGGKVTRLTQNQG